MDVPRETIPLRQKQTLIAEDNENGFRREAIPLCGKFDVVTEDEENEPSSGGYPSPSETDVNHRRQRVDVRREAIPLRVKPTSIKEKRQARGRSSDG